MSNAVSALNGANASGYVSVADTGLAGMITLRGDISSPAMAGAVKAATGLAIPAQRRIESAADKSCAWMSPDELLVLVPYTDTTTALTSLKEALNGEHHLVAEVSDARALFQISGTNVREVIAKLCPVDMSETSFAPGDFRRTRMAQVPAAFWMQDENTVNIICFRSVAQYVFDLLKNASAEGAWVGNF